MDGDLDGARFLVAQKTASNEHLLEEINDETYRFSKRRIPHLTGRSPSSPCEGG